MLHILPYWFPKIRLKIPVPWGSSYSSITDMHWKIAYSKCKKILKYRNYFNIQVRIWNCIKNIFYYRILSLILSTILWEQTLEMLFRRYLLARPYVGIYFVWLFSLEQGKVQTPNVCRLKGWIDSPCFPGLSLISFSILFLRY